MGDAQKRTVLFPTHLIVAYLVTRDRSISTPLVVLGAAVPDLIDKPLALLNVTSFFHSIGHSILVVALLYIVFRSEALSAVLVGWSLHIVLDVIHLVLNGRSENVVFTLWPVLSVDKANTLGFGPVEFVSHYVGTVSFWVEIVVWGVFAGVLIRKRIYQYN